MFTCKRVFIPDWQNNSCVYSTRIQLIVPHRWIVDGFSCRFSPLLRYCLFQAVFLRLEMFTAKLPPATHESSTISSVTALHGTPGNCTDEWCFHACHQESDSMMRFFNFQAQMSPKEDNDSLGSGMLLPLLRWMNTTATVDEAHTLSSSDAHINLIRGLSIAFQLPDSYSGQLLGLQALRIQIASSLPGCLVCRNQEIAPPQSTIILTILIFISIASIVFRLVHTF